MAQTTVNAAIRSAPVISAEALAAFLLKNNPNPRINCTALELAKHFITEGYTLMIRADIAFCQSIHETGWFKYGGQVLPDQNNYAGIGATNNSPVGKGAWFESPQIGARAQMQHLFAYCCKDALPFNEVNVDPRFGLVTRGIAPTWEGLNGRWAVPGTTYAQSIIALYNQLETFAASYTETPPKTEEGNKLKIYLSPSNQPGNAYITGGTNEKVQMEAIAALVKQKLDAGYNVDTVMATLSMGIGSSERPLEAKNKGCQYYIAIHSNAAGVANSNATGAVAFYHPNGAKSQDIAKAMVKELNAICPIAPNRASQVASGMTQFDGSGYGEIRSPMNHGVVPMLVEVNFHDHKPSAEYIINNKDAIAGAIVKALVDTLGITKKSGATDPVTPPVITEMYRVRKSWADSLSQIGAYTDLNNAKKAADENAAAGYKVFNSAGTAVYTPTVKQPDPEPEKPVETEKPKEEPPVDDNKNVGTGDNPSGWAKEATTWAKANGLFAGDGNGNFDWQGNLTREQAATLLQKFAGLINANIQVFVGPLE